MPSKVPQAPRGSDGTKLYRDPKDRQSVITFASRGTYSIYVTVFHLLASLHMLRVFSVRSLSRKYEQRTEGPTDLTTKFISRSCAAPDGKEGKYKAALVIGTG